MNLILVSYLEHLVITPDLFLPYHCSRARYPSFSIDFSSCFNVFSVCDNYCIRPQTLLSNCCRVTINVIHHQAQYCILRHLEQA